jgi:hypothetical protein
MTTNNKKLVNLATGKGKTPAKEVAKKEKVVEKVLSPEEQRDLKAKETVKELLTGVELDLTVKPKEELLEMGGDEDGGVENAGDVWLQEQVAALTSENEVLKIENDTLKLNYQKILAENQAIKAGAGIQSDNDLKTGILTIFHELQSNYIKMGFNQQPRQEIVQQGEPNFRIAPAAFINRLIVFFPFLAKEKRF